jgi:hypothetical protein
MRLRRQGVPCTASKWGYDPLRETRKGDLTPGEVQSVRKLARREQIDPFMDMPATQETLSAITALIGMTRGVSL